MQALEHLDRRKKPLTYGRARKYHNTFALEFNSPSNSSARSSPSRLLKPGRSPARSPRVELRNGNEDVFDVPSSDDEPTPKRQLSTSKGNSLRSTQSPSPAIRRVKTSGRSTVLDAQQSQAPVNTKKRKRPQQIRDKARLSPTSEEIEQQLDLQFQYEVQHILQEPNALDTRSAAESTVKAKVFPKNVSDRLLKVKPKSNPPKTNPTKDFKDITYLSHHDPRDISLLQDQRTSSPKSSSPLLDDTGPATPQSQMSRDITPGQEKRAMSTPRQNQLWKSVLGADSDSVDRIGLNDLDLDQRNSPTPRKTASARLPKKRLVDQLKKSRLALESAEEGNELDRFASHDDVDLSSSQNVGQRANNSYASMTQNTGAIEGGSKITYASQRSYLREPEMDIETLLQQPLELEDSPMQTSKPDHIAMGSQQALVDAVIVEEEDESKPLKSVHELRAAGTSHRFSSDMEATLVELAGVAGFSKKSLVSSKRTAWLDLCNRFNETDFRSRFSQGGYDYQVFALAGKERDQIVSLLVAVISATLLADQGSSQTARQIYSSGAVKAISMSLAEDRDMVAVGKDRTSNLSKTTQATIKEISIRLRNSSVWNQVEPNVLSPRLIALKALELTARRLRESGGEEALLDDFILQQVLNSLQDSTARITTAVNKSNQDEGTTIEICLSLLESSTVVPSCASDSSLWNAGRVEHLVSILDSSLKLPLKNAASIDQLALRLCLNLANNNEANSNLFAWPPFILKILSFISTGLTSISNATDETSDSPEVDNLILSLGAMINLAEWSDDVREVVATSCPDLLIDLLQTFMKSRKSVEEADSIEASRANVVFGYLAVLLANLCQNERVCRIAKAELPKKRLDVIVEAVEEFIGHNERADREQGTEMWVAFTQRLQSVANLLKALEA